MRVDSKSMFIPKSQMFQDPGEASNLSGLKKINISVHFLHVIASATASGLCTIPMKR
jgi:hypothetical protein